MKVLASIPTRAGLRARLSRARRACACYFSAMSLAEKFHDEIFGLMAVWRQEGIDTRGIASGKDGCSARKVAGWIRTSGSRKKFDTAIRTLGPAYTVESKFLLPEFEDLVADYSEETAKARDRLLGHRVD